MEELLRWVPSSLVAITAVGMGIAFIVADPESQISRLLALGLATLGLAVGFEVPLHGLTVIPWWARWFAVVDAVCFWAFLEWILRVRRTVPAGNLNTKFGDYGIRIAQVAAVFYGIAGLIAPEIKHQQFLGSFETGGEALLHPGFWLFGGPTLVAGLLGISGATLFLRRKPDPPEQARVVGLIAATPFLLVALVLPISISPIFGMLGLIFFLIGAVRYHVLQGKRGEFMARFLSPKVAELVRRRGMRQAMQETRLDLTAVCVDLRGFTAYAEALGSARVVNVLREYYHLAGEVIARYDGTIKDLAGDGILILVGAPLPVDGHAQRALEMAHAIRASVREAAKHWSDGTHKLGVGIGVASGEVIVGAIEAGERFEYTAVGLTINLASRLCEEARDGEILVAQRTIDLAAKAAKALEPRQPLHVKGFAEPVAHRNLGFLGPEAVGAA
jgi:adenylate cyclase